MLVVEELQKSFGKRPVVRGVSINIQPREVVGLLGKNGAGKSTTFRMIIGTIRPDSGRVAFDGRDLSRWPMHRRCRSGIGYLAQEPTIFTGLSVEDNILAILEQLALSRKERRARCEALLNEFGLTKIRKNIALRCSGGEKRRLEIARALVTQPRLILLDEPFAGVDPIATVEIRDMVKGLKDRGIAVLITDHDVRETLKATDRAYIMDDGKILFAGTPRQIVDDPLCRQVYIGTNFEINLEDGPPKNNPNQDEPIREGHAA